MAKTLPKPHARMSSWERGRLVLQYLHEGVGLEELDFSEAFLVLANLKGACLGGIRLEGAHLAGAKLIEANLEEANLKRADLRGAYLYGANLEGANLEGANLEGANLEHADLRGAYLKGASLERAHIQAMQVDSATLRNSVWDFEVLRNLTERHAILVDADALVGRIPEPGLSLYLSRRVIPWEQTLLQVFAVAVLGKEAGVRIVDYTEFDSGCRVTFQGPDDALNTLGEHIAEATWVEAARQSREAHELTHREVLTPEMFTVGLTQIRQDLERMELRLQPNPDVLEMQSDQVKEHLVAKDRALVRTWERKGLESLLEMAKKLLPSAIRQLLTGGGS